MSANTANATINHVPSFGPSISTANDDRFEQFVTHLYQASEKGQLTSRLSRMLRDVCLPTIHGRVVNAIASMILKRNNVHGPRSEEEPRIDNESITDWLEVLSQVRAQNQPVII
jgi:hypothetical protein